MMGLTNYIFKARPMAQVEKPRGLTSPEFCDFCRNVVNVDRNFVKKHKLPSKVVNSGEVNLLGFSTQGVMKRYNWAQPVYVYWHSFFLSPVW